MSRRSIWIVGVLSFLVWSAVCVRVHVLDDTNNVIAQPVSTPLLQAMMTNVGLTLRGTVPDQAVRRLMVDRATRTYGFGHVVDELTVQPVIDTNWFATASRAFPPDLRGLAGNASATLRDGALVLEGLAKTDAIRAEIIDVQAKANPNLRIDNRITLTLAAATAQLIGAVLKYKVVEFTSGSATLTDVGRATLDQVLPDLQRDTQSSFSVAGHTDNQGTAEKNLALSQARAQAVKEYLVSKGVAEARLTPEGLGDTRPAFDNNPPDGRQRNRRIEFRPK